MKKHTGLIIGIIAAVVVLVGGAAAYIFAGDYIVNSFMLLTKSDEEYYKWLADRQTKQTVNRIKLSDKMTELLPEKIEELKSQDMNGSVSFKLHVTEDFCDMFNLYTFKDEELDIRYAASGKAASVELVPKYGGKELISIKELTDTENGSVYVQIPTYNEGIVDLTPLFDMEIPGVGKLSDYIEKYKSEVQQSTNVAAAQDIDVAEEYDKLARFLIDSVHDVSLEKKCELTVNGEVRKINKLKLAINSEELKELLKGLTEIIYTDFALNESALDKNDLIKLFDELDKSAASELTLYVDGRAKTLGFRALVSENATKLAMEVIPYSAAGTKGADVSLEMNSVKLADIAVRQKSENGEFSYSMDIVPAPFAETLLNGFMKLDGISLGITAEGNEKSASFETVLYKSGSPLASIGISSEEKEYSGQLLDLVGKQIYRSDEILDSDYLNLTDLAKTAFGIIDAIDEEFVNNFIDEKLGELLGEGFTLDTVREYVDLGLLDLLGGFGSTEPPYECPIAGIESPSPETYVPSQLEYPDENATYRFSHYDLVSYSDVGKYRGVGYTVPLSKDITEEQYEKEKSVLLKKYVNKYTYNDKDISVQTGDEIYFDIVPMVGSMPMTMYAYNDCYELMGTDTYGEGLDEKIVGMKVNEVRDVTATLGDQFGDFAGYSGVFRVTLKQIVRYVEPEWNEAFLCGYAGFDSVKAAEDYITQTLISRMEVSEESVTEALLNIIWENTVVYDIPQEIRNGLMQECYNKIYDYTCKEGMRPEAYYEYMGYTVDELRSDLEEEVSYILYMSCFYGRMAYEETLTLSGSEVRALVDDYMKVYEIGSYEELMQSISLEDIVDVEIASRLEKIIYDTAVISYE